ncbi:hypothetical protein BC830DRAFT_1113275 [Chytriomyces sp. MP71]|nr:hypothetical protein BC830DRAFT_1113275 [Chytriomyces sp. MP71]
MNPLAILSLIAAVAPTFINALATPSVGTAVAAGYLLLNPTEGPAKLKALADNAATLPVNRVYLSFVRPDMVYVPGSNTLQYADIGYATSGDWGFAEVKQRVTQLQAGGVEVFLSMGGWNYNCYPYFYTKYSIGSGAGPNQWKITQYGGGNVNNCNESNMWCYTCEPESQMTTLKDFIIFPEPANTATWKAAQAKIKAGAKGNPVTWHPEFLPGSPVTDPVDKTTITTVPGNGYFASQGRDPYADLVSLAKDLNLDGVDIDYEEMWHADTFRTQTTFSDYKLDQTVYKYSAIMADVVAAIQANYSTCKLSTAAGAAGGDSGHWWGGNLKGLWYYSNLWYPDITKFMSVGANAGGINVMTYDLSNNPQFSECPQPGVCDLAGQVNYYMGTYAQAGIVARVGYEIGQPAYPDPSNDPTHQIPLTQAALTSILSQQTSASSVGGFFWELYKPKNSDPTGATGQPNNIDATTLAQQVCAKVLPNASRCKGVIPQVGGGPTPSTTGPVPSSSVKPSTTTSVIPASSPIPSSTKVITSTSKIVPSSTTSKIVTTGSSSCKGSCATYGASQCCSGTEYYCGGASPYTWLVWYQGC